MGRLNFLLYLLIPISVLETCLCWQPWGWMPFSSKTQPENKPVQDWEIEEHFSAEFSLRAADYREGIQEVENTRLKLRNSNSCWQKAYEQIFSACSEIISEDNERRQRFAWDLSNCFQNDSGRPLFPHCHQNSPMKKCLAKLDDISHQTYLKFFLETSSICYQLQAAAFRRQTEQLVNDLKNTAHFTEEKLENLEKKSDEMLKNSDDILESLNMVDQQTREVSETTRQVSNHLAVVEEHSRAVFEQSQQIVVFQTELKTGQEKMKSSLEEGMASLHESYNNLGEKINDIKTETIKVEQKISEVGNAVSDKMTTLETKADDIGRMAGISLNNQQQLLDYQNIALRDLQSLTESQSEALRESRTSLQELFEFVHQQREMVLQRQDQLKRSHEDLGQSLKTMLEAQDAFAAKQAHMFVVLDKLFSLHNAMLVESRIIKAFFIYCISMFVVYLFTSTKQTYTVRPRLYIGLSASFLTEIVIVRFITNDVEQQTMIINLVRSLYAVLALIQLLYTICTYRDYELLNHQMLLTLMEKVNGIKKNSELMYDTDSDMEWSSWVDTDLPDDVNNLDDPDYTLPEEIGENSLAILPSRTYDLRYRR
ncbi:hypothetical protein SLA2020_200250 [Shorea laevis]